MITPAIPTRRSRLIRAASMMGIAFYNNFPRTEEDPFPESLLIAYIPTDRVFELEILDDETGEPVGFLFEGGN